MRYFITQDENGDATIISPVPPKAQDYEGFNLILEEIPPLPSGYKYVIKDDVLTVAVKTESDNQQTKENEMSIAFGEIEAKTATSIAKGFEFEGVKYALDQQSQLHWLRLYNLHLAGDYQTQNLPTLNNSVQRMPLRKIKSFFDTYHTTITAILESERVAKELKRIEITQ